MAFHFYCTHFCIFAAAATESQYCKIACTFSKFLKAVRGREVNKSKLTSRNAFIVNLFALQSERESKYD